MGRMSRFDSSWECGRNAHGKRGGLLAASDY